MFMARDRMHVVLRYDVKARDGLSYGVGNVGRGKVCIMLSRNPLVSVPKGFGYNGHGHAFYRQTSSVRTPEIVECCGFKFCPLACFQ